MVGHSVTLADISVCCALVDGMSLVLDESIRKEFGNVMRWFDLCLAQQEFSDVLGKVKLCAGAGGAKAPAPKEAKPKQSPRPRLRRAKRTTKKQRRRKKRRKKRIPPK